MPTAQAWANTEAQRIIDEQLKAISDQRASYEKTLQDRADSQLAAAQRFAEAVKSLGLDKAIQGVYGSAAGDLAGLAGGFSGGVRDLAAADAAQQANILSGTGQEGAVRDAGGAMADVLYGLGGYIPGNSLGQQGAAFAADAAAQPGFILQRRASDANQALQDALLQSDQTYGDAALKARLSRQDLSEALYAKRVEQNLAQQKLKFAQFNEDRDYWLKLQALYISQGKLKLAKQAEARAQRAENRYRYETMGRDADGNVAPGFVQLPDGSVVPRSKVGGGKKMTPGQKADILKGVLNQEDDMVKALPDIAKAAGWDRYVLPKGPGVVGAAIKTAVSAKAKKARAAVVKELWDRYSPRAITPESKKALRKLINRLVTTYRPATSSGSGSLTAGLLP